jgi:4-hydroxy-tetrahydrodipicolinate reductase
MTTRIGIAGITGRMGQLLAEEVRAAGATLAGGTSRGDPDLSALAAAADAVVDFTNAATAQATAATMAASGKAWILGTSGLSGADEAAVEQAAAHIPVVCGSKF